MVRIIRVDVEELDYDYMIIREVVPEKRYQVSITIWVLYAINNPDAVKYLWETTIGGEALYDPKVCKEKIIEVLRTRMQVFVYNVPPILLKRSSDYPRHSEDMEGFGYILIEDYAKITLTDREKIIFMDKNGLFEWMKDEDITGYEVIQKQLPASQKLLNK